MKLIIHTDGGARGNPGPAAIGVHIQTEQGKTLAELSKPIGETTNNVAEYSAVIEALEYIKDNRSQLTADDQQITLQFFLDSTLVVNQINGLFKVKEAHLRELLARVRLLEAEVGGTISYTAVRREQNVRADLLVNKALDEQTFRI